MDSFHNKVMQEYEAIRQKNSSILKKRREEIEKNLPTVIAIEKEIATTAIGIARANLNVDNSRYNLKATRETLVNLKAKKAETLVANNYPMDYLDSIYNCPHCKDEGYINGIKCRCYSKILTEVLDRDSEFSRLFKDFTFENFDLNLFSDEINRTSGISQKENMRRLLNFAKKYSKDFDNHTDSLFLFGKAGTGKTFLATSIAREIIKNEKVVVYRTSSQLIDDLASIVFSDNRELKSLIYGCDLLIIDDLGTEVVNKIAETEVYNLINQRLLNKKKMIISTNLDLDRITKLYTERVTSRIIGDFKMLNFYGDDLRRNRGLEEMKKFNKELYE